MGLNKEIYEMARILCNNGAFCAATHCETFCCPHKSVAEKLYEKGYRKTFTRDLANNEQKAFKEGYQKGFNDKIEEFADKLKEYARACKASGYDGIGEHDIDELLKEYKG